MHIRIQKPKELSTISFNSKRFKLSPIPPMFLSLSQVSGAQKTNPEGARQPQLQSSLYL